MESRHALGGDGQSSSPRAEIRSRVAEERAPEQVADRIMSRLSAEVGRNRYERYFDRRTRISIEGRRVDVTVADDQSAELLHRRFGTALRRAVQAELNLAQPAETRDPSADVELRFRVDRAAFTAAPASSGSLGATATPATNAAASMSASANARAATESHAGGVSDQVRGPAGRTASSGRDESNGTATPLRARSILPPLPPSQTELKPAGDEHASMRPGANSSVGASMLGSDAARAANRARPRGTGMGLRCRLETFVVGSSNRLAFNSAQALADGNAQFSTLFVHGGCGLGKTHLLQGIANRFTQVNPGAVVRYTTGESFTNDFITALRTNKIDQFRRAYRGVDLLCLDDVHFLANKDATQVELLHTFDAIGLEGARVAMASDEHPREIRRLSEQLISRFLSGVVVRLDPPELELRVRIVRKLAEQRGLDLEEVAIKFMAERSGRSIGPGGWGRGFGGSVRDIEGMLTQVEAVHRLLPELTISGSTRIGLLLVRKALGISENEAAGAGGAANAASAGGSSAGHPGGGATGLRPRRPIHAQTVIAEVCRALRVDLTDFQGKGRHKRVVLARGLTVVLARQLTAHSYPEIARAMNRPNHSTVVTAFQRLEEQMADPARTAEDVAEILGPEFAGVTLRDLVERLSKDIVRASD